MTIDSSLLANDLTEQDLQGFAAKLDRALENMDERSARQITRYSQHFSSIEQVRFLQIMEEYRAAGHSTLWEMLWQLDFERQPVSFEEWIEDPYYMGKLGAELWPLWKKELGYVCDPRSSVVEWYITGAIGLGKTYAALVAQIYKGPYYCSCLKSPQKYFGIAEDSEIVFGLFNAIIDNATQVDFGQIAKFVKRSTYFKDHCPAIPRATQLLWPSKNMMLKIGSSEMHALGTNLFGYMVDEVNFMKTPEAREEHEHQAYKIYHATSRRMQNRFHRFGVTPGLACIVSSRLAHSSFLERLMRDNKDNLNCHVSDYAVWDARGRDIYSPVEFHVAIGDKFHKSQVLSDLDTESGDAFTYKLKEHKKCPDGQQFITVPADFYFEFQRDTDGSLRDIAGIPTFGASPLIYNVESVHRCAKIGPPREHPFLNESHELSMDDPDSNLLHYLKWNEMIRVDRGRPRPVFYPEEPRFIHCDLGLTGDCAAIAMGCAYDKMLITDQDLETGQLVEYFKPKIWVDFMLRITPVRGEQIDLAKIVLFILNLRHRGFFLQRVTFDGFASEMAIQAIRKANQIPERKRRSRYSFDDKIDLQADVLSVDKDDKPYKMLRDCLFQNAVNYYYYPPFVDEVLELEHDVEKKKVDHPVGGSKDVADALCGMVYGITTSRQYFPVEPSPEMLGIAEEKTIETGMIQQLVSDYPDAKSIKHIMPAPRPEPKSTKVSGQVRNWMSELEGFGKHRRPT